MSVDAPVAPASGRVRAATPSWHEAVVAAASPETPNARRLLLDVGGWPGSAPGQHLDLRLTAEDGYTATRSYSIASTGPGHLVELAVDRVEDGEVSAFLVDEVQVGDRLEVLGPLGGWFVWTPSDEPDPRPVQLIAGGSGVVPMLAMVRAHAAAGDAAQMRLLYAVRTPEDVFHRAELDEAAASTAPLAIDVVYSRRTPPGRSRPPGRITRDDLAAAVVPPERRPRVFVCGSTPFVEQVLTWLAELGHDLADVRAERFGGA